MANAKVSAHNITPASSGIPMDWTKHVSYVLDLEDNLDILSLTMDDLAVPFEEIRRKVEPEGLWHKKAAKEVGDWLSKVEAVKGEVRRVLREGDRILSSDCLGGFCPWNFCDRYELGKVVDEKQTEVEGLLSEADSIYRSVYSSADLLRNLVKAAGECSDVAEAVLKKAKDRVSRRPRIRKWLARKIELKT